NAGLGDLKIVNKFVTEEYKNLLKKMREWYLKGYIPKDYATAQVQPSSLQNANKLFAITNTMGFDKQGAGENPAKLDVRFVDGVKKTSDNQMFLWAVPSSAQRVDKSIQFLNLVFQDKELTKLLKYGIKGEHYDELNGGVLDVNKGLKTYRQAWPIWGNSVSLYAYEQARLGSFGGNPEKYKASEAQWIKDTKTSKAYGFIFNSDPVKTELAALNAVQEQYLKLLEGGAVDPEKELKNFNDKLYAAGLKKVMDEKQKQLDEWVKTKK
ncbi:MAG: hypothetical protein K0R84_2049, partial [Clostridia bacterium]|nr:hypothetical protein [Clostridia bacterium]